MTVYSAVKTACELRRPISDLVDEYPLVSAEHLDIDESGLNIRRKRFSAFAKTAMFRR